MGNCLEGCMKTLKDLTEKKIICPKCKRYKWNKRKSKEKFLNEGCTMCTMREKYKFKPLDLNDARKYKATGRYYSHSGEVTIEKVDIFAVDDKKNKKIKKSDNYLPFN